VNQDDLAIRLKVGDSDSEYNDIMQTKKTILIFIIALALILPAANAWNTDHVIVSPDNQIDLNEFRNSLRSIGGTIYPDESDTVEKYIPSDVTKMTIHLDWSGHQHPGRDSVRLTIFTPGNGDILGPYYDSADGQTNEKITLTLSQSYPLPSGTWKFLVFGDDVSEEGTPYDLNIIYYT